MVKLMANTKISDLPPRKAKRAIRTFMLIENGVSRQSRERCFN